ncbi:hypothetical protein D3273_08830 [Lichenibacterium minor]|uniref:Uncharacterized protein n=1 Tax=Lichenibacterium minor TaxID=2316528 RepID=A0A4Q2U741_9HYPH|nr:hypothetical protein [Lichenibacterium minor]RYC32483.1 hypothetical protein D3273_08830 [Lichenibacterium minor]
MSTSDHIQTTGSAVTILTGIVAAIVFLSKLENRVSRLEEQVRSSTLAPSVSTTDRDGGAAAAQAAPNAVAQNCGDLAKQNADEISKGFLLSSDRIQKTMAEQGCARQR